MPAKVITTHHDFLVLEGAGHLVNWRATDSSQFYQDTDPSLKTLRSFVSRHILEESVAPRLTLPPVMGFGVTGHPIA